MLALELIANEIPPVHPSDTVQKVAERMAEFRVRHLPVVNEDQFLGLIADEDLVAVNDNQTPVGALTLSLVNPYVLEDQHIYDVIRLFHDRQVTIVPVLDAKMIYLGADNYKPPY